MLKQPISGKLNTPIRKFAIKRRVLLMHDAVVKTKPDVIGKSTKVVFIIFESIQF